MGSEMCIRDRGDALEVVLYEAARAARVARRVARAGACGEVGELIEEVLGARLEPAEHLVQEENDAPAAADRVGKCTARVLSCFLLSTSTVVRVRKVRVRCPWLLLSRRCLRRSACVRSFAPAPVAVPFVLR